MVRVGRDPKEHLVPPPRHQQGQDANDRQVSGGLSERLHGYVPLNLEYLWLPTLPLHSAPQRCTLGTVVPLPCSGKPRVLQHDYLIWSLAKPSAQPGDRKDSSRSHLQITDKQ